MDHDFAGLVLGLEVKVQVSDLQDLVEDKLLALYRGGGVDFVEGVLLKIDVIEKFRLEHDGEILN